MTRTSIGIHVHAEPTSLAATLEQVRAHTPSDVALLLLPDGPEPALAATLRALRHLPQLATAEPRGAAACFNRLAATSEADVLILLESGSLVGPGWLEALLGALDADPCNGLAGPSTNAAWNEQCAFPGRGGLPHQIAATAGEASVRFAGHVQSLAPLYSLADFCFAVRREVVEAIGAADEGYGLGPCWEMDYAIRAARAGFRSVWAAAAYVHRLPFTRRRHLEEQRRFEASKRRYQDHFCGLRLRGERTAEQYEPHCRGDACEHFAPRALIQLHRPLPPPPLAPAPAAVASEVVEVEVRDPRPLVSCIMPTRDRPAFVQQAIRLFQRQDYPARELVIVDDSATDALGDLVRDEPGVRYLHLTPGHSIGSKRNQAVSLARGELIAQWDDDDWYAPQRLSAQVAPILAGRADVTGLDGTVFFDLPRWEWWTCSPVMHQRLFVGDVHGGTLVFRRRVWEQLAQYPDRSLAEDAIFLRNAIRRGARLHKIAGGGLFVYLRHADNSWSFRCGSFLDPRGWQRLAQPSLPADDLAFYAARSAMAAPQASAATLVSCIMPTADRRPWVPYAIDYFLRQDFPARELVVLDDGHDAIEDLIPPDERVRYLRTTRCASLGAKRNLCVEAARGDVLLHWDDDDWMAPRRIRRQLHDLRASGAEVGGMRRLVYHRLGTPETFVYDYPPSQRPWVVGCTLIYSRDVWRRSPFPGVTVGEDTRFLFSQRIERLAVTDDDQLYVGMIHPHNTGPKTCRGPFWSRWPGDVRTILGADAGRYLGPA